MPNAQFPTLSNAQGQIFPQMTAVGVQYWQDDSRWAHDRICPRFRVGLPNVRITRWSAADALPSLKAGLLRAKGDTGAQLSVQAPTYEDFFINEGMLTALVPNREVTEAPKTDPDRPFRVRTKMATGFLHLEAETRVKEYFDPTGSLFPASQLVAPSGNWETYNPDVDSFISKDMKSAGKFFTKASGGTRHNFVLFDQTTDTFFLEKLAKERTTRVTVGSYSEMPDLLPSADGRRVGNAEIVVPGTVKETTPADAVYSPDYVWGDFPYVILGYSPTLDGSEWDQTGEAYIANGVYVPDGEQELETYKQPDPVIMNKRSFMWWNFNRQLKALKPELVVAIGPIR